MGSISFEFLFVSVVTIAGGIYVAKEECPTNEEYLLCGSTCPYNCSYPEGPVQCTDDCAEGCFCMSGFLRNDNGTCVTLDQCPGKNQVCGVNEELLPCGTACAATCSDPEPEVCGVACSMGCFCKSGFVRDETTNQCVTFDNCPPEQCFNDNEVYDICNAACEPSCADPEPICTKLCSGGCICSSGLLRGPDGSCISVDKCPANSTEPGVLRKYLNAINDLLHLAA